MSRRLISSCSIPPFRRCSDFTHFTHFIIICIIAHSSFFSLLSFSFFLSAFTCATSRAHTFPAILFYIFPYLSTSRRRRSCHIHRTFLFIFFLLIIVQYSSSFASRPGSDGSFPFHFVSCLLYISRIFLFLIMYKSLDFITVSLFSLYAHFLDIIIRMSYNIVSFPHDMFESDLLGFVESGQPSIRLSVFSFIYP